MTNRYRLRFPIQTEIFTEIEDIVLYEDDFATFDSNDRHAAVLPDPAVSISEFDIPMDGDDVVTGEGEYLLDADVSNIKVNLWELVEESPEPTFYSGSTLERAA